MILVHPLLICSITSISLPLLRIPIISADVLEFFASRKDVPNDELVCDYLGMEDFHGMDLNQYDGLCEAVTRHLDSMDELGAYTTLKEHLHE